MLKAKKQYGFDPDYAVPPGETLKEVMESLDMTQKELSIRTGLTVQSLNRISKGEQPITYETANRLELTTGISARMWNNLESQYREQLAKIREREQLESDLSWLKTIPTRELIERDAIAHQKEKTILLRETLKYYGVSSVSAWKDIWEEPAVAARRSHCFETCPGPASAWLRLGEIEAHQIDCMPYDKNKFLKAVEGIRQLTVKEPDEFIPEMRTLCSEAGVALALIPEMKKVPWNGATRWLSASKAMILLNLRGKTEDQFWFSFFHEAGHALHDSKKDVYINDGSRKDLRELKADGFAAETLIPKDLEHEIVSIRSSVDVERIAKKLKLSPGVVVGRFQHLTEKWSRFNKLKRKFKWS
ncbi:MAG: ImmA/IrrE family metallo-endopeptidase [Candidatus Scalindua sp.]|nr:ImmA/IrrE family metallo-endopeptidase [Candidatus Scalindua sp.]